NLVASHVALRLQSPWKAPFKKCGNQKCSRFRLQVMERLELRTVYASTSNIALGYFCGHFGQVLVIRRFANTDGTTFEQIRDLSHIPAARIIARNPQEPLSNMAGIQLLSLVTYISDRLKVQGSAFDFLEDSLDPIGFAHQC